MGRPKMWGFALLPVTVDFAGMGGIPDERLWFSTPPGGGECLFLFGEIPNRKDVSPRAPRPFAEVKLTRHGSTQS